uniref:uncharacterized protein LOC120339715 n=1 Tax=Styela clava TaxID=7725 RepID=UPI00193A4D59|nr:uncharacterized protein LOC120339715 [Styela clava]
MAQTTLWFVICAFFMMSRSTVMALSCNKIDSCKCEMSDGTGQINLKALGTQSGTDSAYSLPGGDGWLYKYNPCYPFSWGGMTGLAVVQSTKTLSHVYDLGTQNSAYFNTTDTGKVSIHYTALDARRMSRIQLICDAGVNTHDLRFLGELVITEYDFILSSPCACPGLCNDDGIINPVNNNTVNQDSVDVIMHDSSYGSYMWIDVGGAMVALLFHDILLVMVIVCVVFVIRATGCCTEPQKNVPGFGPSDVINQVQGKTNNGNVNFSDISSA